MRLVISRGTFALEDLPGTVDLSDVRMFRTVSWDRRRRRMTWRLVDAGRVRAALEQRGVRLADVEVRAAVHRALEDDPIDGPAAVAAYGDVRAIAALALALDAYEPCADCAVCDYLAVLGLGSAIQLLGGSPTESQQQKIADYEVRQRFAWSDAREAIRTALAQSAPLAVAAPAQRERLGRNDPCHCGSGKKYKLCHLELDLAHPDTTRH